MPLIDNKEKRKYQLYKSEGQQYYNNFFRNKTKPLLDTLDTNLSKIQLSLDLANEVPNLNIKIYF
jgi:hypothetical protein